jgi:hypothetical protein
LARIRAIAGGRRAWATRLSVLVAVGALVGLIVAIVPVLAGVNDPIPPASGQGVTPIEVDLGGQPNDCSAPAVGLGHLYDFRIEDPAAGTYTDTQSGFTVTFEITSRRVAGEEFMDYEVSGASVYGLVIKGGSNSAFYAYDPAVGDDTGTHATRKNNGKLYQVSHASFCYDIVGTISGMKWHDHDADGGIDDDGNELGIEGWEISLFSGATLVDTVSTDPDGDYTFENVSLGPTYTVCEEDQDNPVSGQDAFDWTQTDQSLGYSTWGAIACSGKAGQEPAGHTIPFTASVGGIDFGNLLEVSLSCDGTDGLPTSAELGDGTNVPKSIVSLPTEDCNTEKFTSPFDVGLNADDAGFRQFVVFGGTDTGVPITQKIIWTPETGDYSSGQLEVPTTQVILDPDNPQDITDVIFCDTELDEFGDPVVVIPDGKTDCLINRIIDEGFPLEAGDIQLTENYMFLGDPPRFR